MSMSPLTKVFIYGVIAADVFALAYFSGNYVIHGSILPHEEEARIVVEAAKTASNAPTEGNTAATEPAFDYATYVADATKGASVSAKCKACHSFGNGEPNRVGPNLFGVFGGPLAHRADFAYSDALKAKTAEIQSWDDAHLFAFIEKPKDYIPGTKMQFNGIANPKDRADLIAYLKTLK